jgi:hypothetical protein
MDSNKIIKIVTIGAILLLISLLILLAVTYFARDSEKPNKPKLKTLNSLDLMNNPPTTDNKLSIATKSGDVIINNVFSSNLETNGDYFTFYSTSDSKKWIDYEPSTQAFVIHGVSEKNPAEFETDRKSMEKILLAQLGIKETDACKLNAFTITLGLSDPSWKFKEWPLSFCN